MNDTVEPIVRSHANRDPLTGEPGSHPVGTGPSSAVGAAAGAAAGGAIGGPRPCYPKDRRSEDLESAYRYGWERATAMKACQRFEEVESELERTWPTARGDSPHQWKDVRDAARDSWTRAHGL